EGEVPAAEVVAAVAPVRRGGTGAAVVPVEVWDAGAGEGVVQLERRVGHGALDGVVVAVARPHPQSHRHTLEASGAGDGVDGAVAGVERREGVAERGGPGRSGWRRSHPSTARRWRGRSSTRWCGGCRRSTG